MSERRADRITVACVLGTRPDAVKMAPVVKELAKYPNQIRLIVISTGQHREMLDQVLRIFDIKPDYDLMLMRDRNTLEDLTARGLSLIMPILHEEKPDLVIAQGDTTTTFVASLAAFYAKAKFGHVEAGLRSGEKFDPFPEEMNRRLTTRLADLHFAPTQWAADNLLREGVQPETIRVTGNTVVDALNTVIADTDYQFEDAAIATAVQRTERLILVTAHRRENWGEPMERVCHAILDILERFPDTHVVFPMHKNPVVRETVMPILQNHNRILLCEPPDYFPFVHLMRQAHLILTDSGGVQEEAPGMGKPVLVLRKTTERPEGVHAGAAKLVGTDRDLIVAEATALLGDSETYAAMSKSVSPYGDGTSARQIREWVFETFGLDSEAT